MPDDDSDSTPIADSADSAAPALAPPTSITPNSYQASGDGTGGPWEQGDADEGGSSILVRGAMGHYAPLDESGSDGQSGADGWGPLATLDDFGTGVTTDDQGTIHGLKPRGAVDDPPSQEDDSSGSGDISGPLRQFSFDEDMGTPRELPDWANDQRFGLEEGIPDIDDLSGEIYKGTARPWADDFLANYEKEKIDESNSNQAPNGWEIYRRAGGDIAKEGARSIEEPNSCALRVSRALDLAGGVNGPYAIPVNPDDHLSIAGTRLRSYDTAYSELQDKLNHATLGYISNASEMNTYLEHTWGAPDIPLNWDLQHDTVQSMKAKVDAIQASLGPGEAAVFARPNHTGVITSNYMDQYAEYPPLGTMNVWILRAKPR